MADTNGILTWGALIGAGVIVGRLSNSIATDIARSELAEKSDQLDDILDRSYGYVPERRHRDELTEVQRQNRELRQDLEPAVKKAAKRLKRKAERGKSWAGKVYERIPFVGKKKDEEKDDSDAKKSSRIPHEDEEGVEIGVRDMGDTVQITMSKEEWEELSTDE